MSLNIHEAEQIKIEKDQYRRHYRKMRENLTKEDIAQSGAGILKTVTKLKEYTDCSCIAIYYSFKNEIDTLGIIEHALLNKKKVLLPKITDNKMNFYKINALSECAPGTMSIPEPVSTLPERVFDAPHTLLFMPGIVFNKNFQRIGFGGGYYDRFLKENRHQFKKIIALAYTFQVIEEELPVEPFDICPDMILTPERIYTNEKK